MSLSSQLETLAARIAHGSKVAAPSGRVWSEVRNSAQSSFLLEVQNSIVTSIVKYSRGSVEYASTTISRPRLTVRGVVRDEPFQIRLSWGKDFNILESEMKLGSKRRSGKIDISALTATQVASDAIHKSAQGLL